MERHRRRGQRGRGLRAALGVFAFALIAGTLGGAWLASDVRQLAMPKRYFAQPALADLGTAEREEARYRRAVADGTLVDRRQSRQWTGLRATIVEPTMQPAFTRADHELTE